MANRPPRRVRHRADLDACLQDTDKVGFNPPATEDADSHVVGYGKPPRQSQFKPGRSGNPRGRPKNPTAFDELIEKELSQLVTVREGNQARRLPKRSVIVKQVVKKAMEGEDRALRSLLTLLSTAKTEKQKSAASGKADPDAPLTKTERKILAEYETQVREKILQEQQLAANQPTSTTGKDMEDEDR